MRILESADRWPLPKESEEKKSSREQIKSAKTIEDLLKVLENSWTIFLDADDPEKSCGIDELKKTIEKTVEEAKKTFQERQKQVYEKGNTQTMLEIMQESQNCEKIPLTDGLRDKVVHLLILWAEEETMKAEKLAA